MWSHKPHLICEFSFFKIWSLVSWFLTMQCWQTLCKITVATKQFILNISCLFLSDLELWWIICIIILRHTNVFFYLLLTLFILLIIISIIFIFSIFFYYMQYVTPCSMVMFYPLDAYYHPSDFVNRIQQHPVNVQPTDLKYALWRFSFG